MPDDDEDTKRAVHDTRASLAGLAVFCLIVSWLSLTGWLLVWGSNNGTISAAWVPAIVVTTLPFVMIAVLSAIAAIRYGR